MPGQFTQQGETTEANDKRHQDYQHIQAKEGKFAGWAFPPEQARLPSTFSTLHPTVSELLIVD